MPHVEYRRRLWRYVVEFKGPEDHITYETEVYGRQAVLKDKRGILLARLFMTGELQIWEGYGWDGASGPALDTPSFMDASLVHDCLYQMIEEGLLPLSEQKAADRTMRKIAKAHGMGWFRRWYTYLAVRAFGGGAISSGAKKNG